MFLSSENKRDGKSTTHQSAGGWQSMKFAFVPTKTPSATFLFTKHDYRQYFFLKHSADAESLHCGEHRTIH